MLEPYSILLILIFTMGLFIWGRYRYDVVALIALSIAVLFGAVPFNQVYSGLGNPAVITVACVMIISEAITRSGFLLPLIHHMSAYTRYPAVHIGMLTLLSAVLSAFMNNIGALALVMPIAIQSAINTKRSPSLILMPIALGSAMGGLTTMIGTPPNLLISHYRKIHTGSSFAMFDFSYVGFWVALSGVIFIAFIGWRLLPRRQKPVDPDASFDVQDYITELKVQEQSPLVDCTIADFEAMYEGDYVVLGIIRNNRKRLVLRSQQVINHNDIIIVQASPSVLHKLIRLAKLTLVTDGAVSKETLTSNEIALSECVVLQGANIEGRSSRDLRLRSRFQINLLAIARQGRPFKERLNHVLFKAGDIILLQGPQDALQDAISRLGLLPLLERDIQIKSSPQSYRPLLIFFIAILLAAFQLLPVEIAFSGAVLAMLLLGVIPARLVYDMIDWPIIVLLAAMIPIGQALQTTGGTGLIAHYFTHVSGNLSPVTILVLLTLVTMTLSDFMNNAATAVVMAPIAVSIAQALQLNTDTFLMAVAIGASCSFLTPIGHQNNMLVMGPGGYKFLDYLRIGLPLEIIVLCVTLPTLLHFWPLQ